MTSVFMALLFLIFAAGLPALSLSTNAAQTETGNIPVSGTFSDTLVANYIVVDGKEYINDTKGSSVIYSVMPDTEYYIRVRVPTDIRVSTSISHFASYPSLGSRCTFYYTDYTRYGDYILYNFTTSSDTTFVVLSFRFNGTYDSYDTIRNLTKSCTIADTLGLYSPLSNTSTIGLDYYYNTVLRVTCSAVGGIGNYHCTVDIVDDSQNVKVLYRSVPAGDYIVKPQDFSNMGDNPTVRITVSDYLNNTSATTFDFHSFDYVNHQLSSPEVNVSDIPLTSFHVESSFLGIIGNFFHVLPSEITILLVPVILFCVVGWWLHR